jgi:hypothetical protein
MEKDRLIKNARRGVLLAKQRYYFSQGALKHATTIEEKHFKRPFINLKLISQQTGRLEKQYFPHKCLWCGPQEPECPGPGHG